MDKGIAGSILIDRVTLIRLFIANKSKMSMSSQARVFTNDNGISHFLIRKSSLIIDAASIARCQLKHFAIVAICNCNVGFCYLVPSTSFEE